MLSYTFVDISDVFVRIPAKLKSIKEKYSRKRLTLFEIKQYFVGDNQKDLIQLSKDIRVAHNWPPQIRN